MPIRSANTHYLMLTMHLLNAKLIALPEVPEPSNNAKTIVKKKPDTKVIKKDNSEYNSDFSDKQTDEEESD